MLRSHILLLSLCFCGIFVLSSGNASVLLYNASRIYTGRSPHESVEALCSSSNGTILAGGALGEVEEICKEEARLSSSRVRSVDAQGHFVFPGFIDSHAHLMELGQALTRIDLRSAKSVAEVVELLKKTQNSRLRQKASLFTTAQKTTIPSSSESAEWLEAFGWNQEIWPGHQFPSRYDLDGAFPDTPLWLKRVDGHAGWANSKALQLVGELPEEDPQGGEILRFPNGTPTGVMLDNAMAFVESVIPPYSEERKQEFLRAALAECAEQGVTGLMEAGVQNKTDIDLYLRAVDEGWYTIRNYAMRGAAIDTPDAKMIHTPDGLLTVRGVKFYLDGALGSRDAALLEPYNDDPGNRGFLFYEPEDLLKEMKKWKDAGYQIATHAIGDRAVRTLLDVYEVLLNDTAGEDVDLRLRVEHAQIVEESDVDRLIRLGIIPSVQPQFIGDWAFAEERLGEDRAKARGYLWRSLLERGARALPLGSDFPIEKVRPVEAFFNAVSRRDRNGKPEDGWKKEEALDRFQALKGFSSDAAFSHFAENTQGQLHPGFWADWVVMDRDLLRCEEERLLNSAGAVVGTFVGGREVWRNEERWPSGAGARHTRYIPDVVNYV
uniref:Amidohydrolase 3 domain-containing protein n=1 Tax=Chromera velia CCMP2878 TaxID=1169474 RepID=A0A0G4HZW3_9ALVE|eukprot:Cvel_9801.t1-p1 / transcript=Cvel_9801.t1 / gene=Cvel_9801 / organism=Chromera_velia_CCMP2878 / gene_product=Putative amidohydrolase YtcJ, putative / transcript_product=Putative amidohydrolase YtcJ, putative / location=Cvel_scaffold575:29262-31076(-) / protein_length=605 / sequence_SO=supercontig / SO=protein_coding / is_pseudo=false